jgi:hypothetical protein
MTLPVTRKNSPILSATVTAQESLQTRPHGWDPFEVWRTRILLPRLAEKGKQEAPAPAVQLVRR